ncbi:MAG: vWA domain-containing protein [Gammaproteobacteria bacterium]
MFTAPATPQMPLTERVAGFTAHLRLNGWQLGAAELDGALQFVARSPTLQLPVLRHGLRVLLASRKSEWDRFDELFEAFWLTRGRIRQRPPALASPDAWTRGGASAGASGAAALWARHLDETAAGRESAGGQNEAANEDDSPHLPHAVRDVVGVAASARSNIERTDLRHLAVPDEIERAERIAYRLASALRYRRSRRFIHACGARRLDLRRTIRRNVGRGGDPLTLVHRARPERPVRVVVLLDVSGSMQPYTRFLLQFAKGLVRCWAQADVYLMHTRLLRVTDVLEEKDAMLAMNRLSLIARGFGGGTCLGRCLAEFNDHHAKRTLNSRSRLVVISDGYDTDDPKRFTLELERVKRRVRRLVWLNPLLGWVDYQPVTRTMQAALPYIDRFAPAHSLQALAQAEYELRTL